MNLSTLTWDVVILSGVLTSAPNAYASYFKYLEIWSRMVENRAAVVAQWVVTTCSISIPAQKAG